jgi:hypothetical protein
MERENEVVSVTMDSWVALLGKLIRHSPSCFRTGFEFDPPTPAPPCTRQNPVLHQISNVRKYAYSSDLGPSVCTSRCEDPVWYKYEPCWPCEPANTLPFLQTGNVFDLWACSPFRSEDFVTRTWRKSWLISTEAQVEDWGNSEWLIGARVVMAERENLNCPR